MRRQLITLLAVVAVVAAAPLVERLPEADRK